MVGEEKYMKNFKMAKKLFIDIWVNVVYYIHMGYEHISVTDKIKVKEGFRTW